MRYIKSDRHFVGSHEEHQRQQEGSEVINRSKFVDLSLSYTFTDRLSATLTIPWVWHDRSQVVRNSSRVIIERFHTNTEGLGDMRLMGNFWLFDPHDAEEHAKGNIQVGLGIDMPTGEEDAEDDFRVFQGGQVRDVKRNVDQSIQPGDGGWGAIVDVFMYQSPYPGIRFYFAGTYTFTPEDTSGVETFRSNPFESEMSIADTYMVRLGAEFLVWPAAGLTLGLGGRLEGVMVEDLIGSSDGFRRPGYATSVEPSLGLSIRGWSAIVQVPVAIYRNRQRSLADDKQSDATGIARHGDAAFADYMVVFALSKGF